MTDLLPRVAKAMSDRRQELTAPQLSRIWEELAKVAVEEINREPPLVMNAFVTCTALSGRPYVKAEFESLEEAQEFQKWLLTRQPKGD